MCVRVSVHMCIYNYLFIYSLTCQVSQHDQTAIAVRTGKKWPQLAPQSHGPSPKGVALDNTSRERHLFIYLFIYLFILLFLYYISKWGPNFRDHAIAHGCSLCNGGTAE